VTVPSPSVATVEQVAAGAVDDTLREALQQLWVDASNAGGAIGFSDKIGADDVRPRLDEALRAVAEERELLYVLRVDGRVGGCGYLELNDWDLARHWAWVMRVMVHPDLQGRGLGRVLVDGIADGARARGLEMLRLEVRSGLSLERFYERAGYAEVARVPGMLRVAVGDDRDEITMLRRLV
jgi:GNAT superfamily N-acetyltransferase